MSLKKWNEYKIVFAKRWTAIFVSCAVVIVENDAADSAPTDTASLIDFANSVLVNMYDPLDIII